MNDFHIKHLSTPRYNPMEIQWNNPREIQWNNPREIQWDNQVETPWSSPMEIPWSSPREMPGSSPLEIPFGRTRDLDDISSFLWPSDQAILDGDLYNYIDPFISDANKLAQIAKPEDEKIRQEEEKEDIQKDRQDFREIFNKLDNTWNDLGGNRDLAAGLKPEEKISQLEAEKSYALRAHDSNLEGLNDEKNSLETQLANTTDEDEKSSISEKLEDVNNRIETEEANREETKIREDEKIRQKKEEFETLKNRLYELREEALEYTDRLENGENYYETGYWKEDVRLRLSEINLEIDRIEDRMRTAMTW
jgi:DNA repair exonuclease SbcCD ATPase subunit